MSWEIIFRVGLALMLVGFIFIFIGFFEISLNQPKLSRDRRYNPMTYSKNYFSDKKCEIISNNEKVYDDYGRLGQQYVNVRCSDGHIYWGFGTWDDSNEPNTVIIDGVKYFLSSRDDGSTYEKWTEASGRVE